MKGWERTTAVSSNRARCREFPPPPLFSKKKTRLFPFVTVGKSVTVDEPVTVGITSWPMCQRRNCNSSHTCPSVFC